MPVRRDKDGNPIDERTRKSWESDADSTDWRTNGAIAPPARPSTVDIGGSTDYPGAERSPRPRGPVNNRYDVDTVPARERDGAQPDSKTRIYRPKRPDSDGAGSIDLDALAGDPMDDPPVGWLVVVRGPGRGRVATLGMGVNSIGRDKSQRVALDYGDQLMSRRSHGTITYDPRGRKFYVQHGGGTNLTYVDEDPVLAPRELEPLTQVQMGNTVLRFVPLCGAGFSWDEPGEK